MEEIVKQLIDLGFKKTGTLCYTKNSVRFDLATHTLNFGYVYLFAGDKPVQSGAFSTKEPISPTFVKDTVKNLRIRILASIDDLVSAISQIPKV
jgi:hypothetical protein